MQRYSELKVKWLKWFSCRKKTKSNSESFFRHYGRLPPKLLISPGKIKCDFSFSTNWKFWASIRNISLNPSLSSTFNSLIILLKYIFSFFSVSTLSFFHAWVFHHLSQSIHLTKKTVTTSPLSAIFFWKE